MLFDAHTHTHTHVIAAFGPCTFFDPLGSPLRAAMDMVVGTSSALDLKRQAKDKLGQAAAVAVGEGGTENVRGHQH